MKGTIMGLRQMLAIVCMLGLTGCERTVEDIAKWKDAGNVKKIISELDNEHRTMRMEAARALGELKSTQAVEPLAALLTNKDPQLEVIAIESLAAIRNEAAEQHLINAIKAEDLQVNLAAINGLGTMKSTRSIDALVEALSAIDDDLSTAAATALGRIKDPRAIPPLADKITARSSTLRLNCVKSLASIGGKEAHDTLVIALGDISEKVRNAAIEAFITLGPAAEPYALTNLRSPKTAARLSAVEILRKTGTVPDAGDDLVWFRLAQVPDKTKIRIDWELVNELAGKGKDAVPALLEAVAHETPAIREHAFRTLETIGESCALAAIKAARANATPQGKHWFDQRTNWAGAPAWRIDLWSAAAALNPDFKAFSGQNSTAIEKMLADSRSGVRREQVPLLIALTGNIKGDVGSMDLFGMDAIPVSGDQYRLDAMIRLERAGEMALLPLLSAIEDSDPKVSGACVEVLGNIGDPRAMLPLAEALQRKIDAGEELTSSPHYKALLKFDDPSVDPVLIKVRPNDAYATRVFNRNYPDIRVSYARSQNARAAYSEPIGYKMGYLKDGKTGELLIHFEKDDNGDWLPTPPLSAPLP